MNSLAGIILGNLFNTLLGGRLVVERVGYDNNENVRLRDDPNEKIFVRVEEPFTQDKWEDIKAILRQTAAIVDEPPYHSYHYYFRIDTPDKTSYNPLATTLCILVPSEKSGNALEIAIASCGSGTRR